MRKLSRKVRLERAIQEAEAHVRMNVRMKRGTADLEDWAFTYAVHWGFEEDESAQKLIAKAMLRVPTPQNTVIYAEGFEDDQAVITEREEVQYLSFNIRQIRGDVSYPRGGPSTMSPYERKKFLKLWKEIRKKIWNGNPPRIGRIGRPWRAPNR